MLCFCSQHNKQQQSAVFLGHKKTRSAEVQSVGLLAVGPT